MNQDDPVHRHLFYADERGTTGTAITFFEWPELPRGSVGLGSPHHLSYSVKSVDALPKWMAWLRENGVSVAGPYQRQGRLSLYLRDPDGVLVEVTAANPENVSADYLTQQLKDAKTPQFTSEMKLVKFDHASPLSSESLVTHKFHEKLLGIEGFSERPNPDQPGTTLAEVGTSDNPGFLRYLTSPTAQTGMVGRGNIHHIALAVEEDEDQLRIKRSLDDAGIHNSGIIDRFWFRSLYFRDPDYNLLEIATKKPGYGVDEPADKLGHLARPAKVVGGVARQDRGGAEGDRQQEHAQLASKIREGHLSSGEHPLRAGVLMADLDFVLKFVPSTGSKMTLLLLHGTGGNENDLIQMGKELSPKAALLSPRGRVLENGAPRFFKRLGEGVFDINDLTEQTHALARFIDQASEAYGFDRGRVVAVGYSNGANIAGSLLILHPGSLAGAVLFRPMVPFVPQTLPNLSGKPIMILAGARDRIVSGAETVKLTELLDKAGADVTLRWAEATHALAIEELMAAREWLAAKFP